MVSRRTPVACALAESPATAHVPRHDGAWIRFGRWWFHACTGEWVPVIAGGVAVTRTQTHARFRNDDGSETAATWLASEDNNASLLTNKNYRLRLQVEQSAATFSLITPELRYSLNGGAYTRVNATSSVVRSSASTQFADDDATTAQLTATGVFTPGKMDDVDGITASISPGTSDDSTEVEYCFQIVDADVAAGDTIDFRVYHYPAGSPAALDAYTVTPRALIGVAVRTTAVGGANPTTSTTITIPASVQPNDDLYVAFTSRDHTASDAAATCTDNDSGGNAWTNKGLSSDRKANIFWKKATSGTASKTITVAGALGSLSAGLVVFMGAASGDPTTDLALEQNASGDETHAGFTPTNANSHVCFATFNYGNDNAVSAQSAATLGTLTEQFEHLSTGGADCGTAVASKVSAGGPNATGNITWAQTNGATWSAVWAVKPPAAGAATTSAGADGCGVF